MSECAFLVFSSYLVDFLERQLKAMAAQLSCSFSSHSNSTCDFSARFPGKNEFFPLSSCTRDIKSRLRQLKVAQTSVRSEKDLILARVGFFDEMGNDMTVCPKHRAALGT